MDKFELLSIAIKMQFKSRKIVKTDNSIKVDSIYIAKQEKDKFKVEYDYGSYQCTCILDKGSSVIDLINNHL